MIYDDLDVFSDIQSRILVEIREERTKQINVCKHDGDTNVFDTQNSRNDWISYIVAYLGRASDKVFRNEKEGQEFRINMIKAAALCLAALEAHDKSWC